MTPAGPIPSCPGVFRAPTYAVLWQWTGLGAYLLIVFGPVLFLLISAVVEVVSGDTSVLALMIPSGRRLHLFINTVFYAASVSLVSTAIGTLAAAAMVGWRTPMVRGLLWLPLVLIAIPPYVHALAWTFVGDGILTLAEVLGMRIPPVSGWIASGWVHVMAMLPLSLALAAIGLQTIDRALVEAARVCRNDIGALMFVILPLAAPAIAVGAILVFILALSGYTVPSLFQTNVYGLEIFADFSATNDAVRALALSFPLIAVGMSSVALAWRVARRTALSASKPGALWGTAPDWPSWLKLLQWGAICLVVLQVSVPFMILAGLTGSWNNLAATMSLAQRELAFSIQTAALAGLLCLPLAGALCFRLLHDGSWTRLWWLTALAPLSLPPALVGIGTVGLWNTPALDAAYGTALMPIIVVLSRFTPLAAILIYAQRMRVDPLLFDAAAVLGRKARRRWTLVILPLLTPGLVAAAFAVFVLAIGELAATLLVAPAGQATLTMRIYNYLHYGASESVAALCFVITAVTLFGGFCIVAAIRLWGRLAEGKA